MKTKILLMLAILLLIGSVHASTVSRSFDRAIIQPNEDLTITLTVDIDKGETYYAIDETLPTGWILKDSGTGDNSEKGHLKWLVIADAINTSYEYILTAPSELEPATTFAGIYMFEGMISEQTILGQTSIVSTHVEFGLERNYYTPTYIEQIYRVKSGTPLSIRADRPELFNFSFETVSGRLNPIQYEFGTLQNVEVITPIYSLNCGMVEVPDVNFEGTRQYEEVCTRKFERNEITYKEEIVWQSGYYGHSLESSKFHYLKVYMPITLGEKFTADIVPTFDGARHSKYAFVRADCDKKKFIELSGFDFNAGDTIQGQLDISSLGITDLNAMWVVDENLSLTLGDIREGTTSSTDFNVYFPASNPGNQEAATDTTYALYYDCTVGAHDANSEVRKQNQIGFEDGGTGGYKIIGGAPPSPDGTKKKFGTTAWQMLDNDTAGYNVGLGSRAADVNYGTWFNPGQITAFAQLRVSPAATDGCYMGVGNSNFLHIDEGGGGWVDWTQAGDPVIGNWYYFEIMVRDGVNSCTYSIYDEIGSDLNLIARKELGLRGGAGTIARIELVAEGSGDAYFDNAYHNAPKITTSFGVEVGRNVSPDANIWQIDGYDLNAAMPAFTYISDGNLSVRFIAIDRDDDDLNFNMWYGTSANAKTNRIIHDINLSTASENGDCDTNDKSGMVCTWDWNILGISDNNYWITIEINDGTDTNTATTERSFFVSTDIEPPTIGNLAFEGLFLSLVGDFIDGTGTFFALATDNVLVTSCEYTINGTDWITANYDGVYCVSEEITIQDTITYTFNIRAYDALLNVGTGTAETYKGKNALVDPQAIEDAELINAGWGLTYSVLVGLGIMATVIILLILAMLVLRATIFRK